jgi:hypothetical protein
MPQQLTGGPVLATWPGGIGNPVGEKIPTSGGRRRNTRKNRRNRRTTRKNRRHANSN